MTSKNILSKGITVAAVTAAFGLAVVLPASADEAVTSSDFVAPAAPSASALPNPKFPDLGKDKHGMPFYHPTQLNRVVRTTAYTHSESDHLAYGARNAIGTRLKYTENERSAAADWSVYPLGTRFKIKGEPYVYVVDDYGSALVGTGTIDIYQPSKSLMRKWGLRKVEIQIIQWGSARLSMEKLAGRTGYRHCARMAANLKEQQRKQRTGRK